MLGCKFLLIFFLNCFVIQPKYMRDNTGFITASFIKYLTDKALVNQQHVQELTGDLLIKVFDKGATVLSEGQICQYVFFVESGLLRLYSIDDDGKEHILQFAPENWFISDRGSVFFNQPSHFFIDCVEDSRVVLLDHAFFEHASNLSPEFRNYNEYLLQNHIRHLQNRIDLLIGAQAEKRYLDFVHLYPDVLMRVPQWMVASYLGITPESLSRVRKELAKRNSK